MALESASADHSLTPSTYTRLHITPFDSSLQNLVIPASILPRARNISYHNIETFPEKRFGFVDLPAMDADKIKKKLNGAVLKGSKIRVETARAESIPEPTADVDSAKATKKEKKKSKKRKPDPDMIEGVQLEGRKVKRGWTTTEQEMIEEKRKKSKKDKKDERSKDDKKDKKDKKKKKATVKSKYTDEPECLFKTKLPETKIPNAGPAQEAEEDASTHKKKRKRKGDREVIVHEFEKTTKYPTFLKSSSTGVSAETTTFEDGVGWVDSTGKVLEPVKSKKRAEGIPAPDLPKPKKAAKPIPQEEDKEEDDETSSSGSSSSSDEDDDTSSSDSESDAANTQTEIQTHAKKVEVSTPVLKSPATTKKESARPKSAGSMTSLSIKIPQITPAAKKVHPLEALYKRQPGDDSAAKADAEAQPFSFFGNEDDMEVDEAMTPGNAAPMTPFTKQEFEFRNIRSAAPTPDTAHPSRSFNFWTAQDSAGDAELDEEEEGGDRDVTGNGDEQPDDEEEDVDMEGGGDAGQTPASDFQKQFWETRGDLNRAWRKRRKSAAKEKRYRDNRARAERAI
ncbi:hypothetical protein GGS21DRAFT_50070 [Xylaria nigripes]|nr:hypothetical protein GGS21DRAFT_50070 [Xylaria nigripes]